MSVSTREIWTAEDTFNLFKAVKIYGHEDIQNISEMFPHKSSESIRKKLRAVIVSAEQTRINEKNSLTTWLNCGIIEDEASLVPQALLFIHLFEKQPTVTKNSLCDFGEIYYFLYQMTSGQLPSDLSLKSKQVLYTLLSEIIDETWPKAIKEIPEAVNDWLNRPKNLKVYPGKK